LPSVAGRLADSDGVTILAIGVLLITNWPWLTLGILQWMARV
jgi:hypothetical protein